MSTFNMTDQEFLDACRELQKSYSGNNPKRKSHIAHLVSIAELQFSVDETKRAQDRDCLLGALVLVLASIEMEYCLRYPENSETYTLIHKLFKLTELELTPVTRFIYLEKFYTYYKEQKDYLYDSLKLKIHDKEQIWPSSQALDDDICKIQKYVYGRNYGVNQLLYHAEPDLEILREYIRKVPEKYREAKKKQREAKKKQREASYFSIFYSDSIFYSENKKRLEMINRVECVSQGCCDFYQKAQSGDENLAEKSRLEEWNIYCGLMIWMMLELNNECYVSDPQGGWLTPGSELMKISLVGLNMNGFKEMHPKDRIDYLTDLLRFLDFIDVNMLKQFNLSPESLKEMEASCNTHLRNQQAMQHQYTWTGFFVGVTVSKAVEALISCLTKTAGKTIAKKVVKSFLPDPSTSIAGTAIYTMGTLVNVTIGYDALFLIGPPVIIGGLFALLLSKIGDTVGNAASDYVEYQFRVTKEGLADLQSKLSLKDAKSFCDYVNAMLECRVETEENKIQLRRVWDLRDDEFLKPSHLHKKETRQLKLA